MNKKIIGLCLAAGLIFGCALPVKAETQYGKSGYCVTFTSAQTLESNFKTANLNDEVSNMQPGDNLILTMKLNNQNSNVTDWYMTNEIIHSLEDNSVANGGAYTYRLTYQASGGTTDILYDSDTVGGEIERKILAQPGDTVSGNEVLGSTVSGNTVSDNTLGLHEATGSLTEYFLIDTLESGQYGNITLEIILDGETQGNDYQKTLADLTMNFAVERRPSPRNRHRSPKEVIREISNLLEDEDVPLATGIHTDTVRTSDDNRLIFFSIVTLISGLALFLFSLYCRKEGRKEEE